MCSTRLVAFVFVGACVLRDGGASGGDHYHQPGDV
jgi:hypothetical protein